jgi:hypothetical protein
LLKPGGRVITTVRIHAGATGDRIIAKPDQVDVFRSRAFQQAKRWQDFLPIPPEEIAIKAQRYAERMTSYPISSVDEVRGEFTKVGFSFMYFNPIEVKGEMVPTTYLDLVAMKT